MSLSVEGLRSRSAVFFVAYKYAYFTSTDLFKDEDLHREQQHNFF